MAGIGTDYSQFYRGTESVKTYGSGAGQKDTVVRYAFNTTDDKGNKIMDKMSREQTFRTMNEISSRYGDNVIVEFSGDGLAAFEEHKGKIPLPEEPKREIPEDMITHLEGPKPFTEEELAEITGKKAQLGDDTVALMKVYDPKAYEEMQQIKQEGLAAGTKEGMVAGFRYLFHWITDKAKTDPGWVDQAKKGLEAQTAATQPVTTQSAKEKTPESKLSEKAQKFLEELRKKYGDFDFIVANAGEGKSLLKGSNKEFSVIFSTDELERMAADEKYAAEKMRRVQTVVEMSDRICKEFGYGRAWDKNAAEGNNGVISKIGISFDEDGNMSLFAELEKTSEKQREHIERAREKRAEEKKSADKKAEDKENHSVKRVQIEAKSEEELYESIRKIDWDNVSEE